MKIHAKQSIELDYLNLAPEAKAEVSHLIQSLLAQANNELKLLETKNQALMLELAHLRRIRYGVKSEALSRLQLILLREITPYRLLHARKLNTIPPTIASYRLATDRVPGDTGVESWG